MAFRLPFQCSSWKTVISSWEREHKHTVLLTSSIITHQGRKHTLLLSGLINQNEILPQDCDSLYLEFQHGFAFVRLQHEAERPDARVGIISFFSVSLQTLKLEFYYST